MEVISYTLFMMEDLRLHQKKEWNDNRGYVPCNHAASEKALNFLHTSSPNFHQKSECFFGFKGSKKDAIQMLKKAKVLNVDFGDIVK